MVAVAGVLAGYGVVRLWPGAAAIPVPVAPIPASATATEGSAPADRLPPLLQGGGSSISVVGGMTRSEMARRGILPDGAAPSRSAAGAGDRAATGEREGPPSALQFPPEIRAAAARYYCLCGCAHTLDVCPCNDQPIGAVTMLTYLQSLVRVDQDEAGLDAGMVDRYGPRVLAQH